MNARTIRRAAERQAAKLARKAQPTISANLPTANAVIATTTTPAAAPISPAKLAANQANAKLSCGPTSEIGKQISSKNALKTGLTGRTVILPTDDLAAYEALLHKCQADFKPVTPEELALVQSIVDTKWRLERLVNIEFGIYARGSLEFADQFEDLEPAVRAQMIQVETHLKYEKSLRSLNTQESRLQRLLVKDTVELKRLQAARLQQEVEAQASVATRASKKPITPEVGFVFSNAQTPHETVSEITESVASLAAFPGM